MPGLAALKKMKEVSYKEVIRSDFLCVIPNYPRIAKMERQRLRLTKHLTIGDKISGTLQIYPMGINANYNHTISMVLVLQSEVLKNIEADFQVLILNKSSTLAVRPYSEYFEKKPYRVQWSMSRVADSDFLLDPVNQMVSSGALEMNIELRVYNNMDPEEIGGKSSLFVNSFKSPAFGNTVLSIKGVSYYVDRDVIEQANPDLAKLILKSEKGISSPLSQLRAKELENMLIDCYLKVFGHLS